MICWGTDLFMGIIFNKYQVTDRNKNSLIFLLIKISSITINILSPNLLKAFTVQHNRIECVSLEFKAHIVKQYYLLESGPVA